MQHWEEIINKRFAVCLQTTGKLEMVNNYLNKISDVTPFL